MGCGRRRQVERGAALGGGRGVAAAVLIAAPELERVLT